MDSQKRLQAKKGSKQNTARLLEQADLSIGRAQEFQALLAARGFGAARLADLIAAKTEVSVGMADHEVARCQAVSATRREQDAIDAAKTFLRKLRLAAPLVLRDCGHGKFTLKSFSAGRRLHRTSARIAIHLSGLRPMLVVLDDWLKPYFGGESSPPLLDALVAGLSTIDGEQEVKRANLPLDTLALNAAKGRLLQLIEDLNRIAKIAFDDDPIMAAQFDKRLLLRGKRSRRKKKSGESPAAEVASPASPAGDSLLVPGSG